MQAEQLGRISPGGCRAPAGAFSQACELIEIVFIRTLCVNSFALSEAKRLPGDMNRLTPAADQMHFDPALVLVIDRTVAETCEIEVTIQLAIDADQQVQIEGCGDVGRIVVDGLEDR